MSGCTTHGTRQRPSPGQDPSAPCTSSSRRSDPSAAQVCVPSRTPRAVIANRHLHSPVLRKGTPARASRNRRHFRRGGTRVTDTRVKWQTEPRKVRVQLLVTRNRHHLPPFFGAAPISGIPICANDRPFAPLVFLAATGFPPKRG